jgi:hypothetical protein
MADLVRQAGTLAIESRRNTQKRPAMRTPESIHTPQETSGLGFDLPQFLFAVRASGPLIVAGFDESYFGIHTQTNPIPRPHFEPL